MTHLTDKRIHDALHYNAYHQLQNRSPLWVAQFWATHTIGGQAWRDANGIDPGMLMADPAFVAAAEDPRFMVTEILAGDGGIQSLVYGQEADAALKVKEAPATLRERDGKLGGGTFRRMEAHLSLLKPLRSERPGGKPEDDKPWHERAGLKGSDQLLWDKSTKLTIPGVKILTPDEPGGLPFLKGRAWSSAPRTHVSFLHWDVCLSSKRCHRVLKNRGYGSVLGVDNISKTDGRSTVYQWGLPGKYRYAHGGRWPNKRAWVSVDFCLAVYPKYAARYEKMCGLARPLIRGSRNNGTSTLLGLYKDQIVTWMRIEKVVAEHLGMPLVFATGGRRKRPDFYPSMQKAPKSAWSNAGDGVTVRTHLEYTPKKWDVAGYQEQVAVLALTDPNFDEEFPWVRENLRLGESYWADWMEKVKAKWTWPGVL